MTLLIRTYSLVLLLRRPREMFVQCKKQKDFYMFVPFMFCLCSCICTLCGRHESLREGWGWKRSTCQRAGYQEARGPCSRADNGRLLVRLAHQLHCFAALQGSRAPSPAQWVGSESGTRGWPRVLGCASSAANPSPASQNLDLGGKAWHKRSRGALLRALLSWTHHAASPRLICLFRLGCLQQHIIRMNYGVSWETCRIPCKPFQFFVSKEGETQRHFTLSMQLHVHCSPLNAGVSLQQML